MNVRKIIYNTDKDIPSGTERWLYSIVKNCIGAENAITRDGVNKLLAQYHGIELDERALRRVVEKIRNRGIRLADLEKGGGLFICNTEEEFREFKLRYCSHGYTIMRTARAMEKGIPVEQLTESLEDLERPQAVQMGFL